jgi:hypothetical protein
VRYDVRVLGLTTSELLVLGVIALVAVGPRNLPAMLRAAGRFVGATRALDSTRSAGRLGHWDAALLGVAMLLVLAAWMSASR